MFIQQISANEKWRNHDEYFAKHGESTEELRHHRTQKYEKTQRYPPGLQPWFAVKDVAARVMEKRKRFKSVAFNAIE